MQCTIQGFARDGFRAGWAIALTGSPGVPIPNFYADNSDALADIKACAGVE